MDVYIKRKKRFEINTVNELELFIKNNNIREHFKHFNADVRDKVLLKINNTNKINIKQLKTVFLREFFNVITCWKVEYWLDRGYTIEEANTKITEKQSQNSLRYKHKRIHNRSKYNKCFTTKIEYWISKGYTIEEAKIKLKKRQTTFSRNILIEKYGEKKANEILTDRNRRWSLSMVENNDLDEVAYKRGNNGLNKIKTLKQHINYYGSLLGKQKFASRYWGKQIRSESEFEEHQQFLKRERTLLFYDKEYRYLILSSQNYKCAECGISNLQAVFHLHHIDYDKQNDNRDNLIFLCHSCHAKTCRINNQLPIIEYYYNKNKRFYETQI